LIKLSANPLTVSTMSEPIDFDCSAILRSEITLDQAGNEVPDMLRPTCNHD
jgi:(2R)-sulfolactate sulfo-lyase subunit beta